MAKVEAGLRGLIGQMETMASDLEEWGRAFRLVDPLEAPRERHALYIMGGLLEARADELMVRWKAALHAAHGLE